MQNEQPTTEGLAKQSDSRLSLMDSVAANYQAIILLLVASALHKTWEEIFFIGSVLTFPDTGVSNSQQFLLFKALGLLGCAVIASRIGPLSKSRTAYVTIGGLLILSTACMLLSIDRPDLSIPLMTLGSMSGGLGMALYTVLWFESCNCLNSTMVVLCFLLSRIFAPLVMICCYGLPLFWLSIVGFVLPLFTLTITSRGFCRLHLEGTDGPLSLQAASFWKITVILAFFTYAFAIGKPLVGNAILASGSHTAFGSLLISIIAFLCITLHKRNFDLVFLFRTVMPLTAMVLLALPADIPFVKPVSDTFLSASFEIAEILTVVALANFCWRFRMSAVKLFGIAFGAKTLFCFFGGVTWDVLYLLDIGGATELITICFSVVMVVAIAAAMILLPERKTFEEWGVDVLDDASHLDANASSDGYLARCCHGFARDNNLTSREEEILVMLVQNKTYKETQSTLCIGRETVKTHRRNIYNKCNVHSRKELMKMMGMDA